MSKKSGAHLKGDFSQLIEIHAKFYSVTLFPIIKLLQIFAHASGVH